MGATIQIEPPLRNPRRIIAVLPGYPKVQALLYHILLESACAPDKFQKLAETDVLNVDYLDWMVTHPIHPQHSITIAFCEEVLAGFSCHPTARTEIALYPSNSV